MEGIVSMTLSPKNTGVFDAFYNSIKVRRLISVRSSLQTTICYSLFQLLQPIQLVYAVTELCGSKKMPSGVTEIPFEIPLIPRQNKCVHETYHGVFINIQYHLKCEMRRSFLSKDIVKQLEFIVEYNKVSLFSQSVTTSNIFHHFITYFRKIQLMSTFGRKSSKVL